MNKNHWLVIFLLVTFFALALSACQPAAPIPAAPTKEPFTITATDGLGNQITLGEKPTRIVSLTLGTDEILLDLVGPERLIGVTYLAANPDVSNIADRAELAQVENTVEADPEQIVALSPDLVFVAQFTDPALIEQLQDAGLTVFAVGSLNSIDAMKDNILTLGDLVGEPEKAQKMVAKMDSKLDEIAAVVAAVEGEPQTVLYLSTDGWVAGSGTTLDDIISRAGGVNAAADLVDWNQISEEAIVEMNPDVVLLSPFVTDEEFLSNPAFAGLKAIADQRVFVANDAHLSAVSQYIVLGVEDVARILYPDLFT